MKVEFWRKKKQGQFANRSSLLIKRMKYVRIRLLSLGSGSGYNSDAYYGSKFSIIMVFILDASSEHGAHIWSKSGISIC